MIIFSELDLSSRCERRRRYARQVDRGLLLQEVRQHRSQVRPERPAPSGRLLRRLGAIVPMRRPPPLLDLHRP